MTPDFSQTYFALFSLQQAFDISRSQLDNAYLNVQREVHPDRFVNAPDSEKRLAAQWATQANEAYRTLKSPLNRGRYLLKLNGIDTEEERNTAMPIQFLMEQMEWREAVVDAKHNRDEATLNRLSNEKRASEKTLFTLLAEQLGTSTSANPNANMLAARETVRKLRFLEKLGEEIDLASEAIES